MPVRILVSVDAAAGRLCRYIDGPLTLTHEAVAGNPPVAFTAGIVADFRDRPPEKFRVGKPIPDPPPAGGTPAALAA